MSEGHPGSTECNLLKSWAGWEQILVPEINFDLSGSHLHVNVMHCCLLRVDMPHKKLAEPCFKFQSRGAWNLGQVRPQRSNEEKTIAHPGYSDVYGMFVSAARCRSIWKNTSIASIQHGTYLTQFIPNLISVGHVSSYTNALTSNAPQGSMQ